MSEVEPNEPKKKKRIVKEVTVSDRNLVTKANELIEGRYKLSLREIKLLLTVVSMIEPDDDISTYYKVRSLELIKHLGLDNEHDKYKKLRRLISGLQRKMVLIVKPNGDELEAQWLASTEHKLGSGETEFEISGKLKPYLLQLKEQFTSYRLEMILRMQSVYTIRIYELLKQYETFKSRTISIQELRGYLSLGEGKYKLYGHFKDRVLKPAVEEINKKTDLSTTFEEIKRGRKVVELRFTIRPNKSKGSLLLPAEVEGVPTMVKEMMGAGVSKHQAGKIWRGQWGFLDKEARAEVDPLIAEGLPFAQYVREKIFLLKSEGGKQEIENPGAWLRSAIKRNWKDGKQEVRQKRAQRKAKFEKQILKVDERRQQEDERLRKEGQRKAQLEGKYLTLSPTTQNAINQRVYDQSLISDEFKLWHGEIRRLADAVDSGESFFEKLPSGAQPTAKLLMRQIVEAEYE